MRCWINVSSSALLHNYQAISKICSPSLFVPIIKSNAYGHGLKETYEILTKHSPQYIGVNYLEEAAQLRTFGFSGNILIVGPIPPSQLETANEVSAEIFLANHDVKNAWLNLKRKPKIHVKFDTGMSRQGFLTGEAGPVLESLKSHKDYVVGICSHFANVEDCMEQDYALKQLKEFNEVVSAARSLGLSCKAHIAASASALILPQSRFDMVRVGISLYGLWPAQVTKLSYAQLAKEPVELKPALEWKTEVASVKEVKAGQFIGYGCTYQATTNMKIAVLPVGYAEGYPRIAGNGGSYVLIRSRRCLLVGRICMNMMMVDVSHLANVKPGDVVTLIGSDGDEHLSANRLADWAQTINYELLARLPSNIPRKLAP
ncbi:MAG: alanine racemase [Oligoflexales bacterium]